MTADGISRPTAASGMRWIWGVVGDAARLARRRPLSTVVLPLVLSAVPETVIVLVAIIFHPPVGFAAGMAIGLAAQWLLSLGLLIVVTRVAMRENERAGDWRQGLRSALLIAAWQSLCTVMLAAATTIALLIVAVGSIATGTRRPAWGGAVTSAAVLGWSAATLLFCRWALTAPALATRDHRSLASALRRSAELTRGHRWRVAVLQGVFLAGVLAMMVATGMAQAVRATWLSVPLGAGVAPIGGLLLSFDALLKVAAYRRLGGREAVDGAAAVADVFE